MQACLKQCDRAGYDDPRPFGSRFMVDGIRLCSAIHDCFKHSNMEHLEENSAHADKRFKMAITDGVFSMDGDTAHFDQMVELCNKYDAIFFRLTTRIHQDLLAKQVVARMKNAVLLEKSTLLLLHLVRPLVELRAVVFRGKRTG